MQFSQEQLFISYFLIGIVIAMLFDFFRVLRINFKTSDNITFIEDIIFLFFSGLIIIFSIIKLNNGIFRFFMLIGICFGIIIYSLTLSKVYVIILTVIIKIFKQIFLLPYNYVSKCLQIRKK